jgi:integrase
MARRGNGEGTIVKRKDGRWMGVVTLGKNADGSAKRKSIYGKTRKEVSEKMTSVLQELNMGSYIEPSKTSVGDWLLEWLDKYKCISIKKSTYDSYRMNIVYNITPAIGHIALADLRVDHIQAFVNQLHRNNKSSAMIRKITNIIHGALEQAVMNELVRTNVLRGVKLPKHKAKDIRWFTEEEEKAFLKVAQGDRLEIAFRLDLLSGLRLGELIGLKWDAVDMKNGIIHVKRTLQRYKDYLTGKNLYEIVDSTKTASGKRKIPLPPSAVNLLKQHKAQQDKEKKLAGALYQDSGIVFCTALGNRLIPRNVERSFTRIATKAGIPDATVHSMRHTYATRLFERGVPAKTVSELLGHKDISHTLNVYTHVAHTVKTDAVMVLDYKNDNIFDNNAEGNRGILRTPQENSILGNVLSESIGTLQVT